MRTRLALAAGTVALALALAGCTGGDTEPTPGAGQTTVVPDDGGQVAAGTVDCNGITDADLQVFGLNVQLLAQLNATNIDAMTDGTAGLDLDAFDASVNKLRVLEGVDTGGLGDVTESLDFYTNLGQAARGLIAKGDNATQEDFDAYTQVSGGISETIGRQIPISAAYDASC